MAATRAQLRGDRARARRARPAARRAPAAARAEQGRPRAARGRRRRRARNGASAVAFPVLDHLERHRLSGCQTCATSCSRTRAVARRRCAEGEGEDEVADFAVFRPAASREFDRSPAAPPGNRDRHRRRRRAPVPALGPRERGGPGARRAPPAPHGGDRARSSARASRPATTSRSAGRSSSGPVLSVPVAVVKLGSSIVAEDTGELRLAVVARICEEIAELHARGHRRDRRDLRRDRPRHPHARPLRPPARGRRAAGGLGGRPGPALPDLRREPARARTPVGAGAADVLRHERAHALPERASHAAQARRVARSSRSSTRTTRPPPTRSRSATTTSSRLRWPCWSTRRCCCC